jgi:site-specific recombinase XerC
VDINGRARRAGSPPVELTKALQWLQCNTRYVGELAEPAVTRSMLDAVSRLSNGEAGAAGTVQRQRGVLVNLAEYAIERKLLTANPITTLAWKAPKTAKSVDKRGVVNPGQARRLLAAVEEQKPSGARLVAFFGAMYYAALRPAEATTLRRSNLLLPDEGWGELLIEFSTPAAGAPWTDSGARREQR